MAYGTILGQTQATIPVGGIILWSGAQTAIPTNWQLCDGTNGTPDLRGQFVIGAGGNYEVGNTGGEAKHRLTENEMPRHRHGNTIAFLSQSGGNHYLNASSGASMGFVTGTTTYVGNGGSHNNLPPYYALCYIMKIA